MKYVLLLTALLCSVYIMTAVLGAEPERYEGAVYINGDEVEITAYNKDDSVYVPLRNVFEALGAEVRYEPETKTAGVSYEGQTLEFFQYDSENTVVIDGSIYISLQAFSLISGLEAGINEEGVIYINIEEKPHIISDNSGDFAYKLDSLMNKNENYVFSPISLKYALAMAANGADEDTQAEILNVLGISDLQSFNESVKAYLESSAQKYEASNEINLDSEEPETASIPVGTGLSIANSVWLNEDQIKGGDFSGSFKALVADSYNAEADTVTKNNAAEKINSWCSENTNGKISQIITDADFIAALVNAVYFNGSWLNEFDEDLTAPDTFTNSGGSEAEIDFMNQTDYFAYYGDEDIQIIALPYEGSSISMYAALTDDESINVLEYADRTERVKVKVKLPKFKTETSLNAAELLKTLGIKLAFDDSADAYHFKNMFNDTVNENPSVYISDVLHKTYISVDEEGTEAAAVTALMFMVGSAFPDKEEKIYEFTADRPFTYFIKDNSNGEILFMGRYAIGE